MPPRPFPFALGIGTDICCVSRIRSLVTRKPENASLLPFVRKIFTTREQNDFFHKFVNDETHMSKDIGKISQYLAGRWAAKEAVIKAVNHRRLTLRDVEIFQQPTMEDEGRAVYALISDEVQRRYQDDATPKPDAFVFNGFSRECLPSRLLFHELVGQVAKVSISHDGDYATAVCLAANEPIPGDVGGEAAARMP